MRSPLVLFLLFSLTQIQAQDLINLNPNPKGEPWYVGKLRTLTKEDYRKIEQTPKLKLPASYQKSELPLVVDNSLNKYFRPIFNQDDGSCGQASGIGYHFTYAIDFARGIAANTTQTQYPTHFTYNFLNGGADNGSFYFDGWEIINANGCPNVDTYGGMSSNLTSWMSGYSSYYEAMKNRVFEVFTIDVSTAQGLETLKAWMNDQLNGSSVGGLANFSGGVSGNFTLQTLPIGTPEQGASVITYWDSEVNHAMTFVGYNDTICYDFNGDGLYTNNKDIDGNGVLDLRDFEVGGLIMVNSWGTTWGDLGKAYVPYKLLAEPKTNGGIGSSIVHVIRAKAVYTPKLTVKATITHTSRQKLRITAGVSSNPNATKPDYTLQVPIYNFQGGDHYMLGGTTESDKTIELGLDVTPLLSEINSGEEAKFFLVVEEKDQVGAASGTIVTFSVIDYTNGQLETICSQTNIPIENNDTTFLSLNKTIAFDKVQISTSSLPDAVAGFPYSYSLNAENGTSPYQWDFVINYSEETKSSKYLPISNQELVPNSNDDDYAALSLPFLFPFYNKSYSKVIITTDGSILFGNTFEYVRDPAALISTKAITVYGSDLMLYPDDGDGIWYFATRDSLTIRWKTSKFELQSFNTDFSATLFPSGKIKFSYGDGITASTDWVAGISNGDGISYNKIALSESNSITANFQTILSSPSFPDGLEVSNDGLISFTPKQGDKDWAVTAKVTDYNRISTKKTFTLHSVESLTLTPDTLKFDNPLDPDPWQIGKDLTLTNISNQNIVFNNLDWEGLGWFVSDNPLTYPYTLSAGSSLTLKVKLKSTLAKSTSMIWDTLNVQTNNISYPLSILINPAIFSTSVYPVIFNISDSKGAIEGAKITIDRLSEPLLTNNEGATSVMLPNGSYGYAISFTNHFPLSGNVTISGASQTVNLFLAAVAVETDYDASITIYPNPFSNELTIEGAESSAISIYNLIGNAVIKIKNPVGKQHINTQSFPKGIYILNIEDKKGGKSIRKLIKN